MQCYHNTITSSRPNIEKLVDRAYALGMSQERDEVVEFIKFIYSRNVGNFLEIGTKLGGMFYILANISSGKKVSIDMFDGPWGGWILKEHAYLGNVMKQRNDYLHKTFSYVTMINGNSHDSETQYAFYNTIGKEKLDLLFIDGDHSYEGVKRDYELYSDYVRGGGLIVFHDINDTEHHRNIGVDVGRFWNELEGNKMEFNAHTHWAGIGVLVK